MTGRTGGALLALFLLAGCVQHLPPPGASIDQVVALRASPIAAVAIDPFRASGNAARKDRGFSVRDMVIKPPKGQLWSGWLRDGLAAQFDAIGKLDPGSPIQIGGEIIDNEGGENFDDGHARLSARFRVVRDGVARYDQVKTVRGEWNSSVIGMIAYMDAERHYSGLYARLLDELIADPAFRAAVAP